VNRLTLEEILKFEYKKDVPPLPGFSGNQVKIARVDKFVSDQENPIEERVAALRDMLTRGLNIELTTSLTLSDEKFLEAWGFIY
jgi:hypothetical protein